MGSRLRGFVLSSVVLAALVVAGVGGSSTSSAQADKIVIAISGPTAGAAAINSALPLGTKAFLDWVGGVNGHSFEVNVLNNDSTAVGGVTTVRRHIQSNPDVLVINGSAAYAAAVNVLKTEAPDLPTFVTASAAVIARGGFKNAYGVNPNYTRECYFHAKYAKEKLKATNIAIVWQNDAVGQDVGKNCPNYAMKRQGIAKVTSIPLANTTTDYGPIAAQIKESGAQVVLVYAFAALLNGTQKASQAVGVNSKWMTFSTNDIPYINLAGPLAEGVYIDQFLLPMDADNPQMKSFREQMTKRVGESSLSSLGATGWTIGAIIANAARKATANGKPFTKEAFTAELNKLQNKRLGAAENVTYAGKDHTTFVRTLSLYQVKNGKMVLVQKASPVPAN